MNPILWDLGESVVVRTFTPDDDRELFDLVEANRDRLHAWMPWEPTTTSPADTRRFIEGGLASEHDREANGIWVDCRLAGSIGMSVNVMDRNAELGYWIDGRAEGRGIVTRACERFCSFAFEELGLHRVAILAAVGNTRSRAVAERLGMIEEGIARDGGRVAEGFVDMVTYALLADEWTER